MIAVDIPAIDNGTTRMTACRIGTGIGCAHRNTFLNPLHDATLTRHGFHHTATRGWPFFLDVTRLRLDRLRGLRRLVGRVIRDRLLGDMHRSTCQNSTARCSGGQFR